MAPEVPVRIAWALELLELEPRDRVLEVGCGPGVAASLVADRLTEGHLTAIDRSATAIARAGARNAHHVESGRLVLEQSALANFRTSSPYDKALAVNVNVFWTSPAAAEGRALWAVLKPGGVVHLVYGGSEGVGRDVSELVAANLGAQGFTTTVRRGPEPSLLAVTGQRGVDGGPDVQGGRRE